MNDIKIYDFNDACNVLDVLLTNGYDCFITCDEDCYILEYSDTSDLYEEKHKVDETQVKSKFDTLFNYGDSVIFDLDGKKYQGTVEIIDRFGTFEQNEEPSYDVMAIIDDKETLVKHLRQSKLKKAMRLCD